MSSFLRDMLTLPVLAPVSGQRVKEILFITASLTARGGNHILVGEDPFTLHDTPRSWKITP